MFEAKLSEANVLKKIVEAIKDLVTDVNIDISANGMSIQAMDSSHVALVSLNIPSDGFESFRADTAQALGINIGNLSKVLKLAGGDDSLTLQSDQESSQLKLTFENAKTLRQTVYNMNLITLDSEHLAIPDTEYASTVKIPSGEFAKICREFYSLSETLQVATVQGKVNFSVEGDIGSGTMTMSNEGGDEDVTVEV